MTGFGVYDELLRAIAGVAGMWLALFCVTRVFQVRSWQMSTLVVVLFPFPQTYAKSILGHYLDGFAPWAVQFAAAAICGLIMMKDRRAPQLAKRGSKMSVVEFLFAALGAFGGLMLSSWATHEFPFRG